MKKTTKIATALMALTMTFTMALGAGACGEDSTTTVIRIMNYGGGVGRAWLDAACERFVQANEGVSFEDGKTGVKFKIEHNLNTGVETMRSSNYNIYFDEGTGSIASLARSESLLDISDVLSAKVDGDDRTLESKIDESALNSLKGDDGKYYALPSATWYPGLTYDKDLFTRKNLFFAAPDETNFVSYTCGLTGKTYKFVKNAAGKRSCGINGTYDTNYDDPANDDGLPTSLEELIVLCDRMKKQASTTPFNYPNASSHYVHYLVSSLWASLSGYDMMRTAYDFSGEVEVLTGYETTSVFSGLRDFKRPKTQVKTIEAAEGYYASQNVNRYYALSFLKIAMDQGWFTEDAITGDKTNIQAQNDFVWSGYQGKEQIGMLIEGNYWYNESYTLNTVFEDFYYENDEVEERKLAWMPLPVQLEGTIAEGNGKDCTLLDTADGYAFLNKKMEGNSGLVKACKEFLKFLYTDDELSHFTGNTGIVRAHFDYDLIPDDYNKLTYFQKSIYDRVSSENTKMVFCSADNKTFNTNKSQLRISTAGRYFTPLIDGKEYATFVSAYQAGKTVKQAFESSYISAAEWVNYYKGA